MNEYFPFAGKTTLEHVYKKMRERDLELKKAERGSLPLTPRNINRVLSGALEMGLRNPKIEKITNELVDDVVARI